MLALCSVLSGCIEGMLYHPDRVVYGTPERLGLAFERVSFQSRDGTRLSGWFIPATGVKSAKQAKATVIHFHGNAQNMSAHWEFVSWLPAQGYNVFVFDYRGYGESGGKPDIKGVYEDSNAAMDHVRGRTDVDGGRLLVFGQSLGGNNAIAVVGAGNHAGVRAVAIEATFFSYSTIANDKVSGAGLLLSDTYAAQKYIAAIAPVPLLLIHGTADQVIPYHHSQKLMQAARAPKTLITVPGGEHLDSLSLRYGGKYRDELLAFFERSLVGP